MKKVTLLLFASLFIVPMFSQIRSAYATSSGYERYIDDKCEIYLEYSPIIPYNPAYPTASEEWPFIFEVYQKSYWDGLVHYVPWGVELDVFIVNLDGSEDFATYKRWYPISVSQNGYQISWTLGLSGGPLTIGTTVDVSTIDSSYRDYTEYYYEGYLHLSSMLIFYLSNMFWNDATCRGGGSIGIQNDVAPYSDGDHCLVRVDVTVGWVIDPPLPPGTTQTKTYLHSRR